MEACHFTPALVLPTVLHLRLSDFHTRCICESQLQFSNLQSKVKSEASGSGHAVPVAVQVIAPTSTYYNYTFHGDVKAESECEMAVPTT